MMLQISVWIYDQESSLDTHLQYENVNSTHRINLRYYEDDLHYNSLRVKEGYGTIDLMRRLKKWVQKMPKNQSLQVRMKRAELFEEKKGEYTDQLLESIYEYLKDKKYPDKILVKETKIERDSLKNAFRKIVKRDVRYKLDVNDLNKNIKWDKKEKRKYKLLRSWNYIKRMMKRIPKTKSYGLKYLESIRRMILSSKLILQEVLILQWKEH